MDLSDTGDSERDLPQAICNWDPTVMLRGERSLVGMRATVLGHPLSCPIITTGTTLCKGPIKQRLGSFHAGPGCPFDEPRIAKQFVQRWSVSFTSSIVATSSQLNVYELRRGCGRSEAALSDPPLPPWRPDAVHMIKDHAS